ncbi:Hypothetical predicted protein [Mytilus galloprovincialis]|uniref:LRRNT domain-containing protein n=1 Tax=Mytilus galloprovincialis TaxID=29158 RepID=A0A8B6DJ71_MYTGA|nr:Hypothetical predicted protein [Mytilus galloprovincialis]
MLFETIVVLTLSFLKEVFAVPCTEPSLAMCDCSGTVVNCANKNLAQIPRNIPTDTTRLELNQNKIQSIDATSLSGLTSLEMLFLEYNEISSIEDGAFSTLRSLSILNIHENKLTSIKPDTFKSLGSLRELNLKDNDLTTVSASVFADLTDIVYLYLEYNPLICCKMTDLIDWRSSQTKLRVFEGDCTDFQTSTDLDEIDLSKCPVDGGWGTWSNPICSVTCGNGIQSRNRSCDSPVPSLGGQTCKGSNVDTSDCILRDCPVDGGWGLWSNPTCSVTCGNGIQSRNRSCDSPVPSAGGETCNGSSVETSDCSSRDCPVDGGWGFWSNPTCSVTCGNGIQSRNRSCDSPVPSVGGATCNGSSVDTSDCSLSDCPVNGQWGSWSTGPCSVTCGNGIRYRKRSCDSPPASNNGQGCIGSCAVSVICTLEVCPESRKWKGYHGIRLNSRKCHGIRLNSRRYHGRRLNSRRYHGIHVRLNSSRYHGIRLNSRRYHGIRLNRRRYHGRRLNSRIYHGRRLNSRIYHGRRLNSRRYHGRRLNSRRYNEIRLNSRRYHGIRLNSRLYHGRRLNSRRYHGIRLNSRIYHGIRLNSRRYHGRRLNSRRYHGIRLNSRIYHGIRLNSRRYHGRRLNSRRYQGIRLNRRYKNNN